MTTTRRWGRAAGTFVIGAGLWLGAASPSTAKLWQWTDGAGGVHKVRSIDDIPEAFRGTATEVPEVGAGAPAPAPASAKPAAAAPVRRSPASASPASTAPDSTEDGTDAGTDREGHDRAWWRAQVIEARQQINDLEAKVERLKSEGIRSPIVRKEREARKELSGAQADLKKAKAKLDVDLPEAAAKAGAPASWLIVK